MFGYVLEEMCCIYYRKWVWFLGYLFVPLLLHVRETVPLYYPSTLNTTDQHSEFNNLLNGISVANSAQYNYVDPISNLFGSAFGLPCKI